MPLWKLALFGTETRYVSRLYLIRVIIVAFAIAIAVLAVDIAGNFDRVMTASGRQALPPGAARVLQYLLLRLAYNAPAILPLSAAVGIVWAEWTLTRGYERLIIVNTGRSPFVSLMPALMIGLLVGTLQFTALSVLRPTAVAAQGVMGFRYYGPRLSGGEPETRWIVLDRAVIHTKISFVDDKALLSDVTVFDLDADYRLRATTSAPRAQLKGARLVFDAPQRWARQPDLGVSEILIDPVWLRNIGIEPRFVSQRDLTHLGQGGAGILGAGLYRATQLDRMAAVPRLVALTVLMATLSLTLMRPRMSLAPALRLAAAGYGVHFLSQGLSILGENGTLPAALALWGLPGGIITLCLWYHLWRERKVAKAIARCRPEVSLRKGQEAF